MMKRLKLNPSLLPCSPLLTRRDALRIGSISTAATLMPAGWASESVSSPGRAKADSVIFLWMGGGVTHIDSFDPKPHAPEEIRGTLGTISTALPGVHFGEPMTELAQIADDLCLVRSFSHDSNDHLLSQAYTLSGKKVTMAQLYTEPNLGSVVSKLQGSRNGFPGYIAVPGTTRPGPPPYNLFVGGWLGNGHAPFCVGGVPEQPDFSVGEKLSNPSPLAHEDLAPRDLLPLNGLSSQRLNSRLSLRQQLDFVRNQQDLTTQAMSQSVHYENASHLLTSETVRDAFHLDAESTAVMDQYGTTKIGRRCLLARRLVEAGARFVMVDYGYDPDYGNLWDNHNAPGQNFPHISDMCRRGYHLAGTDRAVAALIRDLKLRGLLQRTLVVFLTEFGRTPKINSLGGRDHWGLCGSIFFAGGGTRAGEVIGASDEQAASPITQPWGPADIAATVYEALGISSDTRIPDPFGRPMAILDHGRTISGVF
ncbi:MAG: DUF1501 domain-containing protein [Planctomycetota bacterium]